MMKELYILYHGGDTQYIHKTLDKAIHTAKGLLERNNDYLMNYTLARHEYDEEKEQYVFDEEIDISEYIIVTQEESDISYIDSDAEL